MNRNLNEVIDDIAKVDAIMYAIETTYLDIDAVPEERKLHSRGVSAFYVLWDAIHKVEDDINKLSCDRTADNSTIEFDGTGNRLSK